MSKRKRTTSNEAKESKFSNLKKLDFIFVFLIIASTWFFGQFFLNNPYLISLFKNIETIPDLLSLCPIFSSSLMISAWFIYRGKSVKSLNDVILFFSASYVLYLFLFENNEYQKLNNIETVINDQLLFFSKIAIIICTIAKTFITLFEFVIDWTKENSEKTNALQQNQYNEEGEGISPLEECGKNERFEFNYKYEKTEENKIEHEELSILKYEQYLPKDSEASVKKYSNDGHKSPKTVKQKSLKFKNKFLFSLFSLSLFLLAAPFIYSLFIHFFR
ncbi:hypothetical protein F3J34_50545 [Klebsiella sp. Ap-873]|nr:hypothetical protein [Klebsiella sp. Ap-873]